MVGLEVAQQDVQVLVLAQRLLEELLPLIERFDFLLRLLQSLVQLHRLRGTLVHHSVVVELLDRLEGLRQL